jgi:hypothetical protein
LHRRWHRCFAHPRSGCSLHPRRCRRWFARHRLPPSQSHPMRSRRRSPRPSTRSHTTSTDTTTARCRFRCRNTDRLRYLPGVHRCQSRKRRRTQQARP